MFPGGWPPRGRQLGITCKGIKGLTVRVQLKPPDEYDDVMFVLRFVDAITHANRWVQECDASEGSGGKSWPATD